MLFWLVGVNDTFQGWFWHTAFNRTSGKKKFELGRESHYDNFEKKLLDFQTFSSTHWKEAQYSQKNWVGCVCALPDP